LRLSEAVPSITKPSQLISRSGRTARSPRFNPSISCCGSHLWRSPAARLIFLPLRLCRRTASACTAAGQAALNNGLLMIAGSSSREAGSGSVGEFADGHVGRIVGPDVNTISIFAGWQNRHVGPGRDVLSSSSRPVRYKPISGLATGAHVAGCAALWAQHSPGLRGTDLWNVLQRSAKSLPFPATRIGAGLVQAP
jgi:hypothetical protein